MERYIIVAPANITSGGPELAHQMCYELNKNGMEAYMYYVQGGIDKPVDVDAPSKYGKYMTKHIVDFTEADKDNCCVIFPEALTDWAFLFRNAKKVLWWMSVDNYDFDKGEKYFNDLMDIIDLHLVQSEYARDFLSKKGITKILNCSDYIGELYLKFILPAEYRKNIIVFNPKKGGATLKPLVEMCEDFVWRPLINMTEEEMVMNMQLAKVYIDFGNHPGKDRIPREAASCGCCIITNKQGSAAYYEDVAIPSQYKFDEPIDYEAVRKLILDIFDNYENHMKQFESYREKIKGEAALFAKEVEELINYKW